MTLHLICQNSLLCLRAMLEEFLYDIISEQICHELKRIGLYLFEDLLLFVAVRGLKLLLNES